MARSPTTSDVFNAIAEVRRREILDTLMAGEKAVGTNVADLTRSQPQVAKHQRVYSLEPARLRPLHEWLDRFEQMWNERLDRMDDYLKGLQKRDSSGDT